jgi:PAS domain S-box-containing protein
MEDNIIDTEKKFRAIVESLPVIIFETDLQGRLTFINEYAISLSGYTRDELLGRHFVFCIAPEDIERCLATARNVMAGIFLKENEYTLIRKDGTRQPVFIQSTPILNEQGELAGLRGVVLDNGKQKQIEAGLRESENKYRTLVNNIKLCVVRSTPGEDGKYLEFNRALEEISGYSREELFNMLIKELFVDSFEPEEFSRRLNNKENLIQAEAWLKRKDGKLRLVAGTLTPIRDEQGKVMYIDGIMEDITERRRTEEILKESEAKFRILAEQSPNMIFINTGSSISYVNQKCVEILGYSKEEYYSPEFSFLTLIAPEDRTLVIHNFARRKRNEDVGPYEYTLLTRGGKRILSIISMNAVEGKNGRVFIGTVTDISERKKMEQQIIELYEKEKKERQELQEEARSRGVFTDVLAHELRTPLTPILASTGMLKDIACGSETGLKQKLIDNIYSSSQTLARRLEDLLDLARTSRGAFTLDIQLINLNVLFAGVVNRFTPALEAKKQHLIEQIQPDLPEAEIDGFRLEQVINNLLSNASHFSHEKGALLLRAVINGCNLQVDVQDNGVGISEESQARLFQPYHRVEQDRQQFPGLGLGLTIAKRIVELHGGKIWLVSQPQKGSTFSFSIPLYQIKR